MNKLLGSFVLVVLFIISHTSFAFTQERNTISMRKSLLLNPFEKRDLSFLHRHEILWTWIECGIPVMPKMTPYIASYASAIQYGFRPINSSPLIVQAFIKFSLYGSMNSTLNHTMMFEDVPTEVEVDYSHSFTQYGIGLKYIFRPSEYLRPYVEANIGRANLRTRMLIYNIEGNDQCEILDNRLINNLSSG